MLPGWIFEVSDDVEVRPTYPPGGPGRYDLSCAMRVLTWNVLHRVHAERHSEAAIEPWPTEALRVAALVKRITRALENEAVEVVLLQEVSGDVLTALRTLPRRAVLNHAFPRVPRQTGRTLDDPTEHLVVIAPPGTRIERAHTFASDPGKGVVVVTLPGGTRVGSTHVTWGPKGDAQLEALAALFRELSPLCIGGDFNCAREVISKRLSGVTFALPPHGSLRTRPGSQAADIDHLLCTGCQFEDVRVLDHELLSDHRPVLATLCMG